MNPNELPGESVRDLDPQKFKERYCRRCKDAGICVKDPGTMLICSQLIENGTWEGHFGNREVRLAS
jgi:hypothetical protein